MALVNFCAMKAGVEDLEVYLKTGGGQISVSVHKGNITKRYNANPDIIIKKRDSEHTSFIGTGEVESSPVVQSYIASIGYIARERRELVLSIVLCETKTVDIFLVNNRIDGYVGPIEMFRVLPIQYNLITISSIKQLIKHLGGILIVLCEKLKMDTELGELSEPVETSEDVDVVKPVKTDVEPSEPVETSEDAEPPTKKVKKAI